jgi:uncharacterized protein (TIGR02145 family)
MRAVKIQKLNIKKYKLFVLLFIFDFSLFFYDCYSQGISISSAGKTADVTAILDISSTSQGLLIPRMTTAQRDNIASPATSLLIFNITTNCFEAYVNGQWYSVSCPPPCLSPDAPTALTNTPYQTQIVWNWSTINGASGYKWNTVNNYVNANDNGNITSYTQNGLVCNSTYTLYVWAYNTCGNSNVTTLIQSTTACGLFCGTQIWASSNLNTGTQVSVGTNQTNNQKWCYNNLSANCDTYGGLYQWNAAMLNAGSVNCNPCGPTTYGVGVQGMCPNAYHIPSRLEWEFYLYCLDATVEPVDTDPTLSSWGYFQNHSVVGSPIIGVGPGSKLRSTSWDGTNLSGFNALPGGICLPICQYGASDLYPQAFYWTGTLYTPSISWYIGLGNPNYSVSEVIISDEMMDFGLSVRCLKD